MESIANIMSFDPVKVFLQGRVTLLQKHAGIFREAESTGSIPTVAACESLLSDANELCAFLVRILNNSTNSKIFVDLKIFCDKSLTIKPTMVLRLQNHNRFGLNTSTAASLVSTVFVGINVQFICAASFTAIQYLFNSTYRTLVTHLTRPGAELPAARRLRVTGPMQDALVASYTANPYPTNEEYQRLSRVTGLSLDQVTCWFTNRRYRQRVAGDLPPRLTQAVVMRQQPAAQVPRLSNGPQEPRPSPAAAQSRVAQSSVVPPRAMQSPAVQPRAPQTPVLVRDPMLYEPPTHGSLSGDDLPLRPLIVSTSTSVAMIDEAQLPSPLEGMDGTTLFEVLKSLPSNFLLL